ncbi:MAG: bifunctional DNA primase/polymerase [Phycisphaerae bacterium]|nr:bifunctional DNA primase/polymerase [Phycisphaerae bacterium]
MVAYILNSKHDNDNICLATGWGSNVFAVVLDGQEGEYALGMLAKVYNEKVPHTAKIISHEGKRLIFNLPLGLYIPAVLRILPGLEVRGNGGYVFLPPSKINGQEVVWDIGCGPCEIEPAEAPAWLIDSICFCMEVCFG